MPLGQEITRRATAASPLSKNSTTTVCRPAVKVTVERSVRAACAVHRLRIVRPSTMTRIPSSERVVNVAGPPANARVEVHRAEKSTATPGAGLPVPQLR